MLYSVSAESVHKVPGRQLDTHCAGQDVGILGPSRELEQLFEITSALGGRRPWGTIFWATWRDKISNFCSRWLTVDCVVEQTKILFKMRAKIRRMDGFKMLKRKLHGYLYVVLASCQATSNEFRILFKITQRLFLASREVPSSGCLEQLFKVQGGGRWCCTFYVTIIFV